MAQENLQEYLAKYQENASSSKKQNKRNSLMALIMGLGSAAGGRGAPTMMAGPMQKKLEQIKQQQQQKQQQIKSEYQMKQEERQLNMQDKMNQLRYDDMTRNIDLEEKKRKIQQDRADQIGVDEEKEYDRRMKDLEGRRKGIDWIAGFVNKYAPGASTATKKIKGAAESTIEKGESDIAVGQAKLDSDRAYAGLSEAAYDTVRQERGIYTPEEALDISGKQLSVENMRQNVAQGFRDDQTKAIFYQVIEGGMDFDNIQDPVLKGEVYQKIIEYNAMLKEQFQEAMKTESGLAKDKVAMNKMWKDMQYTDAAIDKMKQDTRKATAEADMSEAEAAGGVTGGGLTYDEYVKKPMNQREELWDDPVAGAMNLAKQDTEGNWDYTEATKFIKDFKQRTGANNDTLRPMLQGMGLKSVNKYSNEDLWREGKDRGIVPKKHLRYEWEDALRRVDAGERETILKDIAKEGKYHKQDNVWVWGSPALRNFYNQEYLDYFLEVKVGE